MVRPTPTAGLTAGSPSAEALIKDALLDALTTVLARNPVLTSADVVAPLNAAYLATHDVLAVAIRAEQRTAHLRAAFKPVRRQYTEWNGHKR